MTTVARSIRFTPAAWADYTYWQTQDKKTLRRINTLIEAAAREPFAGIGKPEPLLGNLAGYWSRRIDETHRLVAHINPTWTDANGGYLMLFNSSNSEDVSKVIRPLNNSGFGFAISKDSHHAISKIHSSF